LNAFSKSIEIENINFAQLNSLSANLSAEVDDVSRKILKENSRERQRMPENATNLLCKFGHFRACAEAELIEKSNNSRIIDFS